MEQLENGELEFNSNLRFWRTLSEHADQVCVVCSVNVLRREGAWISRRISWEQSVEDIAHELLYFDELKVLSKFKHLIIRFGISGALHISTDEKGRRKGQLVFAPLAKNGIYRNQNEEGFIRGENVLLIAALTKMVADAYSPSTEIGTPDFAEAIKTGLLACMAMFDHGYQVPWDKHYPSEKSGIGLIGKEQFIEKPYSCLQKIFEKGYGNFEHTSGQTLGHVEIPHETMNPSESRFSRNLRKWEILNREVNPPKLKQEDSKGMADAFGHLSRLNVGVGIVMFGKDSVLNKEWITESPEIVSSVLRRPGYLESYEDTPDFITLPFGEKPRIPTRSSRSKSKISVKNVGSRPIYFPIMKFGNLTAIERSDIESLRSMSNLFKTYLEQCKATDEAIAPTSVAVFGPPGAGKSFTVKQLVEEINRDLNNSKRGIDSVEYNVAQFRTVDDLGEAITRASVINNEGRVPLLFFDEFDCKFERQQLGWLKYFLAPMLDGIFYGPRQTIKIGRAIFVFAGGIYSSFNEFANGRSEKTEKRDVQRGALPENGPRETEFRDQKGPDFISRLRGHIDIAPIDAPAGKVKPILRRAMILRGLIEKHKMVTETNGLRIANIDEDIIYALLTMDKYSHGARSMDAILQMCAPIESRIEKASLPSQKQLSMHIDVEEFHARMLRSRSREVPDISPDTDSNADNVVLTGIHPEMNEVADTNETILPPDKAGTEGRHSDDSTVNDQNQ
ncbi:MAG: ATP-binding protein [Planctomycetaceae bacterium]|nr:ATP-binding protein [Planctomycetaceae bacterium]